MINTPHHHEFFSMAQGYIYKENPLCFIF